ncbi:GlsB/YeaQ/YmgE family stress response membrane protein [Dactylosporangium sp. CS-033363]|uniref:GlsB/YeaQ/YmgE family stress response membrane protein n=1 Tax=Dactylosporangium sp. CS-033363 TaxID=3239935 RepID=UPI003D8CE28C
MTVTGVITALIVGLIIGALGRLVVPGRQNLPIWLTIVVGIIAAFLGTLIANAIGISTDTPGVDWGELLVQVVVAAIGVALVAGFAGRGRRAL